MKNAQILFKNSSECFGLVAAAALPGRRVVLRRRARFQSTGLLVGIYDGDLMAPDGRAAAAFLLQATIGGRRRSNQYFL